MSKLINKLNSSKMMKTIFIIFGVAAIIVAASLVSLSLLNSDRQETKDHDSEKKLDPAPRSFTYQIDSFEVPTTIVNGSINKITKLDEANSILVEITSSDQGYLIIQIPKTMLKALNDDYTKFYFFVISNDEETPYEQIDSETIKINFEKDTKKIEIVGASRLN